MSNPFLGEIRMFGGNFAPRTYALASGQILSIQQNTALFSLLGTFYGGNGQTTFALPDLRGRLPLSQGQGPGLSNYDIGEVTGTESVTVLLTQLPFHNHVPVATTNPADQLLPHGMFPAALAAPWTGFWVANGSQKPALEQINATSIGLQGSNQPHENRMPALAVSFVIALQGIFPSRN